jgi:very-short-patch-repair endonuclease
MDAFVRFLRTNSTEAERVLWRHIRYRQLDGFKFRRQRPVGSYVCDFICLEARLIVELDGGQHVEQAAYDSRRDAFLWSRGFRVLRFWNGDALTNTAGVVETILRALHQIDVDGQVG